MIDKSLSNHNLFVDYHVNRRIECSIDRKKKSIRHWCLKKTKEDRNVNGWRARGMI